MLSVDPLVPCSFHMSFHIVGTVQATAHTIIGRSYARGTLSSPSSTTTPLAERYAARHGQIIASADTMEIKSGICLAVLTGRHIDMTMRKSPYRHD